jgi:hypothetical protein
MKTCCPCEYLKSHARERGIRNLGACLFWIYVSYYLYMKCWTASKQVVFPVTWKFKEYQFSLSFIEVFFLYSKLTWILQAVSHYKQLYYFLKFNYYGNLNRLRNYFSIILNNLMLIIMNTSSNFVLLPTNAQLSHKLSHSYTFRHYSGILRELEINTFPSSTRFQMQLLVIEFIIKMFYIGFMQVFILKFQYIKSLKP